MPGCRWSSPPPRGRTPPRVRLQRLVGDVPQQCLQRAHRDDRVVAAGREALHRWPQALRDRLLAQQADSPRPDHHRPPQRPTRPGTGRRRELVVRSREVRVVDAHAGILAGRRPSVLSTSPAADRHPRSLGEPSRNTWHRTVKRLLAHDTRPEGCVGRALRSAWPSGVGEVVGAGELDRHGQASTTNSRASSGSRAARLAWPRRGQAKPSRCHRRPRQQEELRPLGQPANALVERRWTFGSTAVDERLPAASCARDNRTDSSTKARAFPPDCSTRTSWGARRYRTAGMMGEGSCRRSDVQAGQRSFCPGADLPVHAASFPALVLPCLTVEVPEPVSSLDSAA